MGLPDRSRPRPAERAPGVSARPFYGFYFQDDWRATNSLTLNLGLRWEYHTPLVEVKDRQANFGLFSGALELAGQERQQPGAL